jgi:hypothetical protein
MAAWWHSTNKTAWKTDIRKVDMRKSPSWYIVKYITKDRESYQAKIDDGEPELKARVAHPVGVLRRVTFSREFPRRPKSIKTKDSSYVYLNNDDYRTIKELVRDG